LEIFFYFSLYAYNVTWGQVPCNVSSLSSYSSDLFYVTRDLSPCNVDGENATGEQVSTAVEMLHEDLIKHGYMKEHSCFQLDCFRNHQSTYADIEKGLIS